ncbi:MAG TPA: LLM class F420-dependent oxidoreductase [Chloroflexota bacterium]|nr:LLM class F420-dependent oxidoreductase [Chloroflexota bacterium]
MQLGVVFPQTEIGEDPAGLAAYAKAAQELGYQHLLAYDHVVGADTSVRPRWAGPYTSESSFHEPFVLFGYLAGVVPGMELVSGVIILPQRQTVLAAKQAAEVDVLSGGRLRLGIGIGWNDVEYEALGMDFKRRGRRFEEQIGLLRRLWTEPVLTALGEFDRITAAGINPLPIQRPIPLWIGASAEPALKRAATLADGFFPQRPLEGGWKVTLEKMRAWREESGKSWTGFGIEARVDGRTGTADDWRKSAEEWQELGATHISVTTTRCGLFGSDAHIARIREMWSALN